jgi:hypothetical protein
VRVAVVAGPEVVVANVVLLVAAVPAQAEITAAIAKARKGILLKKTSSLSEDEGCRSVREPHDFAFIRDASCVPERQAAWLADPSDQNPGFMSWEGITAAGQRPDSHRDFAAFSGPQKGR